MIIKNIPSIPVRLPEKKIYIRLGYNFRLTNVSGEQKRAITLAMNEAFSVCSPAGLWSRTEIVDRGEDFVAVEGGRLQSASLARLLSDSHEALLMAATAGAEIMDAIQAKIRAKEAMAALVYDAVGSETADAAVAWINEYVRRQLPRQGERLTKHRFSPGYGDLGLENQKLLFDLLGMESLGVTLTESFIMVPEKSVIAIAGIEENG